MGLFDFWKPAPRDEKESATGQVIFTGQGEAVWSNRNYAAFAREGYQLNVVAYQAINRVADAVASVQWEVWRGDVQLDESPLLDLLARPNPVQSGSEFTRDKIGYHLIAGNSYDEKVLINSVPKEMYTLRPDRMRIKESDTGMPSGYIYQVGQRKVTWDANKDTGESDIRHMKMFNPLNDWYGMSPLEAGAYAVDQHSESMKWMQALMQNSARPSGALFTKSDTELSDDAFNRLKTSIEEQYSGSANAGRPMLLEGGLDWKAMGLSPTDMGIIEAKYSSARDVYLAFGVPPQMLGIPGDNTYSNYKEARLAFWEDTVLPLVQYVAAEWTAWLGPHYGDGITIKPDLDKIPAIAEKRMDLWGMADASKDLTIDERRALKGYEPLDSGGDVVPELTTIEPAEATVLSNLVQSVADGMMPAESAVRLAMASFPSMSEEEIRLIISPAEGFVPPVDFVAEAGRDET